jgi:hypothetical protein
MKVKHYKLWADRLHDIRLMARPLCEGTKKKFIPKRADELLKVYHHRIKTTPSFSHLSDLISDVAGKVAQSPVIRVIPVSGQQPLIDWVREQLFPLRNGNNWFNTVNGDWLSETQAIYLIVEHLLLYAQTFALMRIDESKGVCIELVPTTNVVAYEEDRLEWLQPLDEERMVYFVSDETSTTMSIVKAVNKVPVDDYDCLIKHFPDEEDRDILQTETMPPTPFIELMWQKRMALGDTALDLVLDLLRVESYESEVLSNQYVQRTMIDADINSLPDPHDEDVVSDNSSIIINKTFDFKEANGHSAATLVAAIDRRLEKLQALVGHNTANTNKVQSGEAKMLDASSHEDYLTKISVSLRRELERLYAKLISWLMDDDGRVKIEILGFDANTEVRRKTELSKLMALFENPNLTAFIPDEDKQRLAMKAVSLLELDRDEDEGDVEDLA